MPIANRLVRGLAVAALAVVAAGWPVVARAQDLPSYAHPAERATETIRGRIEAVRGPFRISVRDERGFVDEVQLHHGTIITPRGLTLAAGMEVTVVGTNGGAVFDAVEVDTPYAYDGPSPGAVAYGPGWWYPGYDYGYGPAFALGLADGWFAPGFGYGGYVPGVTYVVVQRPFYGRPFGDHDGDRDDPPPGHHWRHLEAAAGVSASTVNAWTSRDATPHDRAPAPVYRAPLPVQNAPVRMAQPVNRAPEPAARAAAPSRPAADGTIRH